MRYLCGNTHIDHDTICSFRRKNLATIEEALIDILELAQELKLLKLGAVSLDGTHIKANASNDKRINDARARHTLIHNFWSYYGMSHSGMMLARLRWEVQKHWRRWLNRRNRRGGYSWEQFNEVLRQLPLAPVRMVHSVM